MKKQIGYKELREIGADKAEKAIRILRSNMDNPTPDKYYNVLNILSKIDKHIKSIQIPNGINDTCGIFLKGGNFQKLNFKGDNLCDVIWKVFKYIHLGIKEDENGTT
jgi:hypothetical protein